MFRALCADHQEVKIVLCSIWYHNKCRWPSGAQVERGLLQVWWYQILYNTILTSWWWALNCLLTPWCRVFEKLTGLQLVKKFPVFHGTRRFITALTSFRHFCLSWASPIQSIYPHPTSWRSILILSTHLRLGLRSGLLPSGFPSKTLYTPLSSPIRWAHSARNM